MKDDRPIFGAKENPLSATQRRTRNNNARIARGVHPNGYALLKNGESCGSCANAHKKQINRTFWKCKIMKNTNGPGTDIRLKWPACQRWVKKWDKKCPTCGQFRTCAQCVLEMG